MTRMLYRSGPGQRHQVVRKRGHGIQASLSETLSTHSYESMLAALRAEEKDNGAPLAWGFQGGKYYSEAQYGVIVAVVEDI